MADSTTHCRFAAGVGRIRERRQGDVMVPCGHGQVGPRGIRACETFDLKTCSTINFGGAFTVAHLRVAIWYSNTAAPM